MPRHEQVDTMFVVSNPLVSGYSNMFVALTCLAYIISDIAMCLTKPSRWWLYFFPT